MAIQSKKRTLRSKKKPVQKVKKKIKIHRGPKKTVISKIAILEDSGLIGCLTGTGVTSKNYKDLLHERVT